MGCTNERLARMRHVLSKGPSALAVNEAADLYFSWPEDDEAGRQIASDLMMDVVSHWENEALLLLTSIARWLPTPRLQKRANTLSWTASQAYQEWSFADLVRDDSRGELMGRILNGEPPKDYTDFLKAHRNHSGDE